MFVRYNLFQKKKENQTSRKTRNEDALKFHQDNTCSSHCALMPAKNLLAVIGTSLGLILKPPKFAAVFLSLFISFVLKMRMKRMWRKSHINDDQFQIFKVEK